MPNAAPNTENPLGTSEAPAEARKPPRQDLSNGGVCAAEAQRLDPDRVVAYLRSVAKAVPDPESERDSERWHLSFLRRKRRNGSAADDQIAPAPETPAPTERGIEVANPEPAVVAPAWTSEAAPAEPPVVEGKNPEPAAFAPVSESEAAAAEPPVIEEASPEPVAFAPALEAEAAAAELPIIEEANPEPVAFAPGLEAEAAAAETPVIEEKDPEPLRAASTDSEAPHCESVREEEEARLDATGAEPIPSEVEPGETMDAAPAAPAGSIAEEEIGTAAPSEPEPVPDPPVDACAEAERVNAAAQPTAPRGEVLPPEAFRPHPSEHACSEPARVITLPPAPRRPTG